MNDAPDSRLETLDGDFQGLTFLTFSQEGH